MLQPLILLLTVLLTSGAKCPSMCTCKHFPRETVPTSYLYYTRVKCDGFARSNETLTNSTTILEVLGLDDQSFSNLVETLLESDLPELNAVTLKHSAVVNNLSVIFDVVCDQINSLNLNQDKLTAIPDLSECSSLVILDLSSNIIADLNGLRTLTARTLDSLNLSENSLESISSIDFVNLKVLKHLDLSLNHIRSLSNQTFSSLTALQFLNLSHNRIRSLSETSFGSLINLQHLDISWNKLVKMAPGCLQLPNLTRLLLSGNSQLGNSRDLIAEVGQKLHTVDASRIGLRQVPDTLTHSIRTLKLAENFIKSITCGELDAYPLLQLLDLASNNINSIEDDALGRQESLSVLYLSGNKLHRIPKSLPNELIELHLERNAILNMYKDDLQGLTNLEVLLLNDNKITAIEGGAFAYLRSLVTLDLSRNSIKALYPGSLAGPLALQILRLSGIDTVAPAEDVSFPLSAPDHLVSLDLSGSAGLARQLLADTAALAASRELQELDISGADLEFIRSDLLHFLPELRVIRMKDNRLNCSNLQWLAVWMRRQDRSENREVICANPPELWGTPLLDLQYADSSSIEHINHDDFEGAINLASATGKNSPEGKYVPQRIATTTYKSVEDKNDNGLQTHSADNKLTAVIKTDNDSTSVNETKEEGTFKLERVAKKDTEVIKVVSKILVSSADLRLSSLIPVSNERTEYFETRSTTSSAGRDQEDSKPYMAASDNKPTTNLSARNKGPTAALNKAQPLFNLAANERRDTSGLIEANKGNATALQLNMSEDASQWNATEIKTSMYRNEDSPVKLPHPGMLILAVGIVCGAATLVTLATRLNTRKRWTDRSENSDDIPVSSISSISELW